jgi:ATP-dependent Clp protease ATP-binding subunit ClpB
MTSNTGSNIIQENFADIKDGQDIESVLDATKEQVMDVLRQSLRPEFLNRIDDVIMFRPLMRKEIKGIIRIQLELLQKQLLGQGISLQFTDYALDYLSQRGFDPQYGARPLKRLIQKDIINMLSRKIIGGEIDKSKPVLIDVFDGLVVMRNEATNGAVIK